jgi:hypothetical protein
MSGTPRFATTVAEAMRVADQEPGEAVEILLESFIFLCAANPALGPEALSALGEKVSNLITIHVPKWRDYVMNELTTVGGMQ